MVDICFISALVRICKHKYSGFYRDLSDGRREGA